jgi:hypothetical protein
MRHLKRIALILSLGAALVGAQTTVAYATGATTFHVEVTKDHDADAKVSLSMPFELLEAFASSIDARHYVAREVVDELEHEGFDLRAFWQQVRDADIREFFTLRAEDAFIRAWREDGMFRVTVDAEESEGRAESAHSEEFRVRLGGAAKVDIRIPESLMDFLVDEGDEATPADLLETLRDAGPMTLVEIETEKESVRIWLE